MACIACKSYREHPKSIVLTPGEALPLSVGSPLAGQSLNVEVKGKSELLKYSTEVSSAGIIDVSGIYGSNFPAYWHIPFTVKVYRHDGSPVEWVDSFGKYNEIRFRTALGGDPFNGILNQDGNFVIS